MLSFQNRFGADHRCHPQGWNSSFSESFLLAKLRCQGDLCRQPEKVMAEENTRDAGPVNDEEVRVQAEIEESRVHWSEVRAEYYTAIQGPAMEAWTSEAGRTSEVESESTSEVQRRAERVRKVAEDNVEVFRSLQELHPGRFFYDGDDLRWIRFSGQHHGDDYCIRLSSEKPFAEGGQAQFFHAHAVDSFGGQKHERYVMKVFKEGTSWQDLYGLLPSGMLTDETTRLKGSFEGGKFCIRIHGAQLLKSNGRFAFLMGRAWGDLRKLMVVRMHHASNKLAPFSNDAAVQFMYQIAIGMQSLHERDIIHRDLKAANVLVFIDEDYIANFDAIDLDARMVECVVADYECSGGVVGTRFWRAPEILLALKDWSIYEKLELFTKQGDVYSFGMTCYEILTGCIPLEEVPANDYDGVIGGERPKLPSQMEPWLRDLVHRCWHNDPCMRPTFEETVEIMRPTFEEIVGIRGVRPSGGRWRRLFRFAARVASGRFMCIRRSRGSA